MKIFNLIWGFSLGAGIDKCYLTYNDMSDIDSSVKIHSVCINITNLNTDLTLLRKKEVEIINIKKQLDFSWINKLQESIDNSKPDIIFTHGFNGAIMVLLLRLFKGLKIPVVTTYHGLYHAPTQRKKILEPIYNGLSRYVYKKLAKQTICVEHMSRKFLISKGVPEHKVVTVHNGLKLLKKQPKIDLKKFNISDENLIILTASRITEVKGLNYLLEAIAEIKDKTKVLFSYVMIGDGPDIGKLKQLAKELEILDFVSFIGYQNNIGSWLETADIFALPSLHEYHSIALLEAMRSGTAIVATDVGGNVESVRNQKEGLVIPSKNVKELSLALLNMLEDDALRIQYGKAAKDRFENNFTEQIMKREILKILKF